MNVRVKSLIGSLLALLGFQSCDPSTIFETPDMYGPGPVEYGCPYAEYVFRGEASDEDGNPIPGIRVVVFPNGEEDEYIVRDTLLTGADGKAEGTLRYDWPDDSGFAVKFEDADGPENGSFQSEVLSRDELTVEKTKEGSGNWDEGGFTVTAKAVLKKKEAE